ncbi:MAG: F0F1 ATP synthase subunit gamma, partial [Patescibacteria group bacterium]
MASIRLIRGRIRTARNIAQITRAMELVAASKMRKAQAQAQAGKLYADKIYEMVITLSGSVRFAEHPLLSVPKKPVGKRLLILISTNKGLCGGLNTSLFRFLLKEYPDINRHDFVTLGRKGAGFVTRGGSQLKADFSQTPFTQSV